MCVRTMMKWMFCIAMLLPAGLLVGCQSAGSEHPEALSGQSRSSQSGSRYEWHGKGQQWGRVTSSDR